MRTVVEYYLEAFVAMSKVGIKGWVKYHQDPMSLSKAQKVLKGRRETDLITPYRLLKKTTIYEVVKEEGNGN